MSVHSFMNAPRHFRPISGDGSCAHLHPQARVVRTRHALDLRPDRVAESSDELPFREVIVPLDGSTYAEHALPWAMQLAASAGCRLRLVIANSRPQPEVQDPQHALYPRLDRILRHPMEKYMADVARRVGQVGDTPMSAEWVNADMASALRTLVKPNRDLVVLATRGRTTIGRMFVGASHDRILQAMPGPLLHVRGRRSPVELTARPTMRRVLVPLDDSLESAAILKTVAAIEGVSPGRQTLLRVVNSPSVLSHDPWGPATNGSPSGTATQPLERLEQISAPWRSKLPRAKASVVWSDDSIVSEILTQADECEADVIAIATRPRGRWMHALRPGVFDQLVRRARIPVLAVERS